MPSWGEALWNEANPALRLRMDENIGPDGPRRMVRAAMALDELYQQHRSVGDYAVSDPLKRILIILGFSPRDPKRVG